MGDAIGTELSGQLFWMPQRELARLRGLACAGQERFARAALFADACRFNALYMIARAGSGHIGSSFSSLDIVSYLVLEELRGGPGAPQGELAEDLYFSSKGHDAPGLYAALIGLGRLEEELIHRLRQIGGLPGHPDVRTPGIVTNTGSLGMGISKAKGLALARRQRGQQGRIYVLTGDGELQEGQIWESLGSAVKFGLSEITVIVDHNKLQSDTFVEATSALGDVAAKFASFGWYVDRVDGHDIPSLAAALARAKAATDRPQVIVADTIKGRGVSFMEHTALESAISLYRFHSGAPDEEAYGRAVLELRARLEQRADELGIARLTIESRERAKAAPLAVALDRLIPAYGEALLNEMARTPELVALDADLLVDTGQLPARERFPERHFECGIAEMDMVSMAGGMALGGLLPVCHSFACFLTARANEHFYNNASEGTRVVYVTSLAGLLPAGPGHSHQGVRDIAALGAIPGLTLLAPSCSAEVSLALDWCVRRARGSSVLRLESLPCAVPYRVPEGYRLEEGVGSWLLPNAGKAVVVGYGPLLLSEAYRALELLRERTGLELGLMNLPWLNSVDPGFVRRAFHGVEHVFALDNHSVAGGQGVMLAAALASSDLERPPRIVQLGVEGLPECGNPSDVLRHHRLDAESIAGRVSATLRG